MSSALRRPLLPANVPKGDTVDLNDGQLQGAGRKQLVRHFAVVARARSYSAALRRNPVRNGQVARFLGRQRVELHVPAVAPAAAEHSITVLAEVGVLARQRQRRSSTGDRKILAREAQRAIEHVDVVLDDFAHTARGARRLLGDLDLEPMKLDRRLSVTGCGRSAAGLGVELQRKVPADALVG